MVVSHRGRGQQLAPDIRVSVLILPCLYASGTEVDVIKRMAGVDAVVGPRESFRYIVWGRLPRSWRPSGRGVVVYMGGELYLAARLAKRLGYPAAAYTEGYINTPGAFARVFVPRDVSRDAVVAKGVAEERVRIVGDLMVDAGVCGCRQERAFTGERTAGPRWGSTDRSHLSGKSAVRAPAHPSSSLAERLRG